jgi:chemotaxis protein methyltransferase CheR
VTQQPLEGSLEGRVGLRLDRAMRLRLDRYAREGARARALSLADYANLVRDDDVARQDLVDRLVVPTTSFFRHPEQFEALRRMLADWPDPVTIWSAGCSSGQETYSLAILLRESGRPGWRVVASDVSTEAVEHTAAGIYEQRELGGLSAERRRRHLEPKEGSWQVAGDLRERVTVVHHNLATQDPPREARGAVAVFCRNVLIYFGPEAQRAFLDGLISRLPGLEVLFLGATESLWGVTDRFVPVSLGHAYVYRPAGPQAPKAGPQVPKAGLPAGSRTPRAGIPATARRDVPAPLPMRRGRAPVERAASAYMAEGEVALAAGDPRAAAAAFRKACYLDADDPLAHLHLGLALEAAGDGDSRRAFAAARAALVGRGTAAVESELKGFRAGELLRLIEHRLDA